MRFWLGALCLFGSLTAHADGPVWAIRGAHNTVYLAGSVHVLKPEEAALPAAFERAYADAEALVMEIDLDDLDPAAAQRWMIERGTLADGATLRQTIGEERHRRVAAEAARVGLPLEGLQQFEPWVIALTLVQLQYVDLGYDPEQGVEKQLQRRAATDGKEILGLETLDEQLGTLDGLSYDDQTRFLELTVEETEDFAEQAEELLRAWREGDSKRLAELLSDEYRRFPALYRALVTERNRRWLPRIERLLKEEQDFLVVVGALHLVGDDGLLELARDRGLRAEPLR